MTRTDEQIASEKNGAELPSETSREIALEEEELKADSEKDVQDQVQQQHVAEDEEKAVESINKATEKLLSPKGLAVEAKLAPAFSLVEHVVESVINDGAADIKTLQEKLQADHHHLLSNKGTEASAKCRR
ncbi:hypothetical protein V8B97DRAFT_5178 [Scleroderma yunnanense]